MSVCTCACVVSGHLRDSKPMGRGRKGGKDGRGETADTLNYEIWERNFRRPSCYFPRHPVS